MSLNLKKSAMEERSMKKQNKTVDKNIHQECYDEMFKINCRWLDTLLSERKRWIIAIISVAVIQIIIYSLIVAKAC